MCVCVFVISFVECGLRKLKLCKFIILLPGRCILCKRSWWRNKCVIERELRLLCVTERERERERERMKWETKVVTKRERERESLGKKPLFSSPQFSALSVCLCVCVCLSLSSSLPDFEKELGEERRQVVQKSIYISFPWPEKEKKRELLLFN